MRLPGASILLVVALVEAAVAAPKKKPKAAGAAIQSVDRVLAGKARRTRSGSAELDRLLEERPAPISWTDSVLTTPVAKLLRSQRGDSNDLALQAAPLATLRAVSDPWIGTRYRTGGNGERGFDCSGFVNRIYQAFGVALKGRSSPSYWTQGEKIAEKDLETGDLVFFSDHSRGIGHVGIYLEKGLFVHASVQAGVIVSAIEEKYYRRRYKGARRIDAFKAAIEAPRQASASE